MSKGPVHVSCMGLELKMLLFLVTVMEKVKQKLLNGTAATLESKKNPYLEHSRHTTQFVERFPSGILLVVVNKASWIDKWKITEIHNTEDINRDTAERCSKLYRYDWRLEVHQSIEDCVQRMASAGE